ncbi:alanine--tRNA ligase [Peptoniphilus equinus]|uniref:Alanine--tRNA ligase n=1 Tax=Peptoniphilus equinus TaxID=3016343 RepID=A0ABY7QU73_9FIRM|nr:alanine--tRNA ligase [Peptoniphilus equinus]WBW50327.1 alanine--tRNA ligase [Peptoniphilus equinus]
MRCNDLKHLNLQDIRSEFLSFFESKNHLVLDSFSLIPKGDKSLLLIGAGMAPMKKYFTKELTPPSSRVTTCQKCIRTGDIENVGKTDRHATFFEMLGNFSFGDYFKKEAISWAWEFLTTRLEIEPEKLWVTVFLDDDEAHDIWRDEIGIAEERIVRLGKDDNFWELEVGPSGPCSEIYVDRGEAYGCGDPDCKPGCDCDRFIEVWNLVFTQFDKDESGVYHPLSHPNIDTGMGLERIATVLQGTDNIFEVDALQNIIQALAKKAGIHYGDDPKFDESIRVITDHIRAMTFMISDSIRPSNEGRGYVLRRLIRRAAKHGKNLGLSGSFLYELTDEVIKSWGAHYQDLTANRDAIVDTIRREEEKFAETIDKGNELLMRKIEELKAAGKDTLDGADAFKLYDTYGFPVDLTEDILKDAGFKCDIEGFNAHMEAQKNRARAARDTDEMGWNTEESEHVFDGLTNTFVGYDQTEADSRIMALFKDGAKVTSLHEGDEGIVVLECTPFYGMSGGQIGDTGTMEGEGFVLDVLDTKKTKTGLHLHHVKVREGLAKAESIHGAIDTSRRDNIRRNHSVTHLLHQALKDVLGDHVSQAGSEVTDRGMRFDFTHFEAISKEDLSRVETIVNDKIFAHLPVITTLTDPEGAYKMGAIGLFEEKYSDDVRVLSMGDYSMELCGGTHVANTSEIGMFKILSESGVASGVRRIESITGPAVYSYLNNALDLQGAVAEALKTQPKDIVSRVQALAEQVRATEKAMEAMKLKSAKDEISDIINQVQSKDGVNFVTYKFSGVDVNTLRNMADDVREKVGSVIVVFATVNEDKLNFVTAVSKDLTEKGYQAGKIIKEVAAVTGGGGGGRPDMATAGGKDISKVDAALAHVEALI